MFGSGEVEAEIARIRAEVLRSGGFSVGGDQLRVLCPDELSAPQQFARISAIAQHEGWSFAFLPNGSVHFGSYTPAA